VVSHFSDIKKSKCTPSKVVVLCEISDCTRSSVAYTLRSFVGTQRCFVGTCCLQLKDKRISTTWTLNLVQVAQSYELVRIRQSSTWPKLSGADRSVFSIYKTNFKLKSALKHGSSFRYYAHTYIDCENTGSTRSVGNRTFVCINNWCIICQIWFM
jgi:hypothetical protein